MKNLLKLFLILTLVIVVFPANAQKNKKIKEVKIVTSAVSSECEKRIEHNMRFEKGIKFVDLDLKTRVLTLKYSPKKTNPDKLRLAVSKLGFDADNVQADKTDFNTLPAVCKLKPKT